MANSTLLDQPAGDPTNETAPHDRVATARVLHVINGEFYSGAERVQDLLASELPSFGFEVGLACVKPGQFPEMRQSRKTPLYRLPMSGRFDLRAAWKLVRIIRSEDYDIVHAHTPRTALLAAIASFITRRPMVYHVHSPTSRDSTRRWRNVANALVERISLARASALVAVSQSLADHVRSQGFSDTKVRVVPNGVPCRRPRPVRSIDPCIANDRGPNEQGQGPVPRRNPLDPRIDYAKINKDQSEWTLGTVALFRPRKGIEVLLQSLADLRSQGLPVRLRAVGGFETAEYEGEIKALTDIVTWTGFTRDVDSELAQIDLFVLPSLFGEGLPMVVLESMAAGVPVVATRVEGTPEAIRDGRDGLIAEPGDPGDLARVIARIVRGEVDWHELRESALARHAEKFSDRAMAAGVAEVYRQVLGGK